MLNLKNMKQLLSILVLASFLSSCTQVGENHFEKSEHHFGTVEVGDAKSTAMDAFNDAYIANDMTGQYELFAENAVANVNGVETTPAAMMEGFLQGRNFYTDITNSERVTGTFIIDNGEIYTNTWFTWTGKSNATGVTIDSPVQASFKWENDKVVEVNFLYDSHDYIVNMGAD